MFFSFLFSFFQFKKKIYICYEKCPSFYLSDSLLEYSNSSKFHNLLLSTVKNHQKIELNFYSEIKTFYFEFNPDYFLENKEIIFKTLSNSQPVTINIKCTNRSIDEYITIDPDNQLSVSDILAIFNFTDKKRLLHLNENSPSNSPSLLSESFDYENLTVSKTTGKYANNSYVNENKVLTDSFTIESSGDQINHEIEYAFDGKTGTYWVASTENLSYIITSFNNLTCIEAIILAPIYKTITSTSPTTRIYYGFPLVLNIYSSLNGGSFIMRYKFNGSPEPTDLWNSVQYVFPRPFCCNQMKLEITEVTLNDLNGNGYYATFSELNLMQTDYSDEYIYMQMKEVVGNYKNADYISTNKIPKEKFAYDSSGDEVDHPLSNAFDGDSDTFWISSIASNKTTKSYINFNFTVEYCIEAILFDPVYTTNFSVTPNTHRYDGFPLILNIYKSSNDEPFDFKYSFYVDQQPSDLWDRVQIVFPNYICCNKLQLEFDKVTINELADNEYKASVADLTLISYECVNLTTEEATGKYANHSYINEHKIPKDNFAYNSVNDQKDHPISNAFDGSLETYWESSIINDQKNKCSVTITFKNSEQIEAILLVPTYATDRTSIPYTRHYGGFPRVLKVYTSSDGSASKLRYVFNCDLKPTDMWDCAQFVFSVPIWCDKLKLEFTEVLPNMFANNEYAASCADISFISTSTFSSPSPTNTPLPIPSQSPYPTQTPSPVENRVFKASTDYEVILIHVENTQFTKFSYDDFGGAVYSLNSGVSFNNKMFTECLSRKAGGAMYISNSRDFLCNITLENLVFNKCQANYGGALFVFAISMNCDIDISSCIFINNKETSNEGDENKSKGGSAIFLTARKAKIEGGIFRNNKGDDSVVKIYKKNEIFGDNGKDYLSVYNSIFEMPHGSKCSILYINENKKSKLDVQDCLFSGDLSPGSNYIKVYYNDTSSTN